MGACGSFCQEGRGVRHSVLEGSLAIINGGGGKYSALASPAVAFIMCASIELLLSSLIGNVLCRSIYLEE